MATSSGRKSSGKKNSSRGTGSTRRNSGGSENKKKIDYEQAARDRAMRREIGLIVFFVFMLFLFLCNFGIGGEVGNVLRDIQFGLFGLTAYLAPVLLFLGLGFCLANQGRAKALRKLISGVTLFLMIGVICELFVSNVKLMSKYDGKAIYAFSKENRTGGGVVAGSVAYLLHHNLAMVGTILVVLLISIICVILLTERSILEGVKDKGGRFLEKSREDAEIRRELSERRREELESQRTLRDEEKRLRAEQKRSRLEEKEEERRKKGEERENEKILRMEKKVTGVSKDTDLRGTSEDHKTKQKKDVHEIIYEEDDDRFLAENGGVTASEEFRRNPAGVGSAEETVTSHKIHEISPEVTDQIPEPRTAYRPIGPKDSVPASVQPNSAAEAIRAVDAETAAMLERKNRQFQRDQIARSADKPSQYREEKPDFQEDTGGMLSPEAEKIRIHKEGVGDGANHGAAGYQNPMPVAARRDTQNEPAPVEKRIPKTYIFPPLSRLNKGASNSTDNSAELKETAVRLRDTLHTFGVNVTITDISQGPSVTRYELQPEQGVKVSKIVGLADDIKLNLAATDIRIEAPIPGKAAIGIEVPNKENMMVALRDLLESDSFQKFDSKLAFAVGKDIAGQTVVADIAKMPHMLIAGSTGSGKSVCINTLIMSILYKAHPDDVKLIMVDPKVVELSVYNGIPHLLIPVVTDPKKASAALHWAVTEMEDRYRKFADYNVRDLKGYNKKVESERESGDPNAPTKLPQIVIIVDELADLMMVSPGEVEESICRLAQLARACGIHLIIATQRPSVDVITGLIKANMPSRIAFAVASGTDSRTILDMVGAEKLLGKGDMLFYPQGYSKPARIQGAFVSDKEVGDVVDFLKNQIVGNVYDEGVVEKINSGSSSAGSASGGNSGESENGLDEYFEKAGRFIIDKDKASIGALQRLLKIGFNRAARIMDQLSEYGVVGEEEGTKPRKVLMSMEQFEQLLEDII